ncbi:aminotransferase class I/II-fold pyridoxal phosphate-dependent enzyme [Paraburkholderia sp. UCT31]|uniref:aminotransferase class I/II-fold pyridoxal phosphate-dependent enzyme n=1 Tax=Paraburkholderia sp. UCT31 TaxID=2615209 RepID=UPI0016553F0C|nr:aminotransferase class I/II-fold pyridoxal phosphate-dependent enzyme [Paraburkholderia sp. UCT31]MBC8737222.1 aminotransferase class I/II-fold pyridoxal phosphate-dependent enzyme [Paraburkholderia sp. UCT31]
MDIKQFAEHRQHVLETQADTVLDLSETRFASVLAPVRPSFIPDAIPGRAHRCHLAEDWLSLFGLPAQWKPRALVSSGVRHSLATLFAVWHAEQKIVALPTDIYPVYGALAAAAQLRSVSFSTVPQLADLPEADILLIAEPVKPRGSGLSEQECEQLMQWLTARPARRIVLDAVYAFGARFSAVTERLYGTGQCIVLHSLAKNWAAPEVFGVALVPHDDVDRLTPAFRALPAEQEELKLAQYFMQRCADFPQQLASALERSEKELNFALAERGIYAFAPLTPVPRYLRVVPAPHQQLLERYGVLALPLSVFGSEDTPYSVVSSLRYLSLPT